MVKRDRRGRYCPCVLRRIRCLRKKGCTMILRPRRGKAEIVHRGSRTTCSRSCFLETRCEVCRKWISHPEGLYMWREWIYGEIQAGTSSCWRHDCAQVERWHTRARTHNQTPLRGYGEDWEGWVENIDFLFYVFKWYFRYILEPSQSDFIQRWLQWVVACSQRGKNAWFQYFAPKYSREM